MQLKDATKLLHHSYEYDDAQLCTKRSLHPFTKKKNESNFNARRKSCPNKNRNFIIEIESGFCT